MSSDGDNQPPPSKRRRYRRIAVPESSDESDSPVVRTLRRRVVTKHTNGSEAAGTSRPDECGNGIPDISSSAASPAADLEPAEAKQRSKTSKSAKVPEKTKEDTPASSKDVTESDAADGHSEQCPICLIVFVNQEVASPASCEHLFCFPCLMEWSKSTNTCPVDRKTFNVIDVRPKFGGKVEKHIPVVVNTNGDEDSTDLGDFYTDDDFEVGFRIADSALMVGIRRIAIPRSSSLSSILSEDSSAQPSDMLNTSSESFGYSSNRGNNSSSASEPLESNRHSEYDEPSSSPIVIVVSSEDEEIAEASSPSEHREASSPLDNQEPSSPDDNRQFSSASDVQQPSSPSDNQRSSSPSADDRYLSLSGSPVVNEEPSSPSVKNEPSSASESERCVSSTSEIDRYSDSSEKEETPPPSEDERTTDCDSDPIASSASSY